MARPKETNITSLPEIPKWLSKEASLHWRRTIELIRESTVLTPIDQSLLGCYCETLVDYLAIVKHIRANGHIGVRGQSAESKVLEKLNTLLLKQLSELGITPESRTRMSSEIRNSTTALDDSFGMGES